MWFKLRTKKCWNTFRNNLENIHCFLPAVNLYFIWRITFGIHLNLQFIAQRMFKHIFWSGTHPFEKFYNPPTCFSVWICYTFPSDNRVPARAAIALILLINLLSGKVSSCTFTCKCRYSSVLVQPESAQGSCVRTQSHKSFKIVYACFLIFTYLLLIVSKIELWKIYFNDCGIFFFKVS